MVADEKLRMGLLKHEKADEGSGSHVDNSLSVRSKMNPSSSVDPSFKSKHLKIGSYAEQDDIEVRTKDTIQNNVDQPQSYKKVYDSILVHRGDHYCQDNEKFVTNFQKLFKGGCLELLLNESVFSNEIKTELEAKFMMD
jgi:hypothetical protein